MAPGVDKHNGRPGMDLWRILVCGVLRLDLNIDYDRLLELSFPLWMVSTILLAVCVSGFLICVSNSPDCRHHSVMLFAVKMRFRLGMCSVNGARSGLTERQGFFMKAHYVEVIY